LIFAGLRVVVVAIGAGLTGFVLGIGGDVVSEAVDTLAPTLAPSGSPTSHRRNELEKILSAEIPTLQFGFSQTEALDWLANEDPAMLAFETTPSKIILERYAIVTLYYSLDGPKWEDQRDFLSEEPVCKWSINNTAGTYFEGVGCNEDCFVVETIASGMSNVTVLPPEIGFLNSLTLLSLGKSQKWTFRVIAIDIPVLILVVLSPYYLLQ
jgi:hypothetical protein